MDTESGEQQKHPLKELTKPGHRIECNIKIRILKVHLSFLIFLALHGQLELYRLLLRSTKWPQSVSWDELYNL